MQVIFILSLALTAGTAVAQFGERPELLGSGSSAVDVSGRSVKNPRVRAIHTTDPSHLGGTAYLQDQDPFLAYQLGRNLNFREFRSRDGVFDNNIAGLAGPMPDGTTAKITKNNQTSCAGCHNLPNGNAGGGPNFHKDSGFGRNTPHYYGAGIIEMLALQVRSQILHAVDSNGDGWISAAESQASPPRIYIKTDASTPLQHAPSVYYGTAHLSNHSTGTPRLNNIFRVWYVDADGAPVPGATSVDGVTTHGFNFEMMVWGWGQGVGRSALNPTNRAFFWDPMIAHSGLESYDPSTTLDPDGDGVSEPTLAGAIQFPVTHQPNDVGANLDTMGFSRDDPDGDGHLNEISEGDLDLAEWFMLNAPRPAFAGTAAEYQQGVLLLQSLGCADCHQPDWKILSANDSSENSLAGDRRFFDLDVQWNPSAARLEGTLQQLYDMEGSSYVRRFDDFYVEGIFTDLAHHEMGADFEEVGFDGNRNSTWRTPPLWGVGSGFPWGHDGKSLSLEHAIERHGGEATQALQNWKRAQSSTRAQALNFLSKLVLYDVESMPTDLNADNTITTDYVVAGIGTGLERFNPEWLFKVPVQIQGIVANMIGQPVTSYAAINLSSAYGLTLPLRIDTDLDGWPDVWDIAPGLAGYKDGIH